MNGIAGCSNKQCVIGGCNPGWENCDDDPSNGCEHPIWTDQECMTCKLPCPDGHELRAGRLPLTDSLASRCGARGQGEGAERPTAQRPCLRISR